MREDSPVWENPLESPAADEETRELSDLAPEMVWRLPGCADLAIRKALQRAWGVFCERTGAMRVRAFAASRPSPGGNRAVAYFASPVAHHHVVRVHSCVRVDGGRPMPLPEGACGWMAASGGAVSVDPRLAPEGARFMAECELAPDPGAESVPARFLAEFGGALVSGALFMLMSQSGRPWSDPQAASIEGVAWQNALSRAARKAVADRGEGGTGRVCVIPKERWA